MRNFAWRLALIGVVLVGAIIYVLPTLVFYSEEPDKRDKEEIVWPKKIVNLGLDLQGGMHLVLEVQSEEAVDNTIQRIVGELRRSLRREQVRHSDLEAIAGGKLSIKLLNSESADKFDEIIDEEYSILHVLSRQQEGETLTMTLDLPENEITRIKKSATDQALENHPQPDRPVRRKRAGHPEAGGQPNPGAAAGGQGYPKGQGASGGKPPSSSSGS